MTCTAVALLVDRLLVDKYLVCTVAEIYDQVIGQDGSEEQLQHAVSLPNIQYQHRDAHDTGLPDQSADLVVVAQALHWFDHPKFYSEVRRILKPSGAFAAWTYALPSLVHKDHPANAVLLHLYEGVLGSYWNPKRKLVESGYRGCEPSDQDFVVVTRKYFKSSNQQTVDELIGYLQSWSAYNTYIQQQKMQPDPLVAFKQQLLKTLGTTDSTTKLQVITPLSVLLAKGPKPPAKAE
eukprot:GHRR01016916.1.p1 GENE.GHRR01016916.1~~GHRR01016916.1.p1  ORF type:complete len:236 (+),score=62.13 GHRR01016916.1:363-1070(+)